MPLRESGMALVLGIESSCDETAVALVDSDRCIVAQRIASQDAEHAPFGGVVPEIAARAHAERLAPMIDGVLTDANIALTDCDAIAATAGPGLIGGVMVGLVSAKALAMVRKRPFPSGWITIYGRGLCLCAHTKTTWCITTGIGIGTGAMESLVTMACTRSTLPDGG